MNPPPQCWQVEFLREVFFLQYGQEGVSVSLRSAKPRNPSAAPANIAQKSPSYVDPKTCYAQAKACPIMTSICRDFIEFEFELHIVTGRSTLHAEVLEQWTQEFLGTMVIHCRPNNVGLDCPSQAQWKADVLREMNPILYIGDNPSIDEVAAASARIPYVDAGEIIRKFLQLSLDPLGILWGQYVTGLQ